MLTPERHQIIIDLIKQKDIVRIHEFVEATGASESTIRRDLSELEEQQLLKRIHGGAALFQNKIEEPTFLEKSIQHEREKIVIARYAAGLVDDKDSIYLDAGTTTFHMIEHLAGKNIIVVTNGVNIAIELKRHGLKTIVLGGELKAATLAVVGRSTISTISQYRFDKCFLGINGIDKEHGLTTPDPDEAYIKQLALQLSDERYILCDSHKFSQVTFARVSDLRKNHHVITDSGLAPSEQHVYKKMTDLKVVKL